MPRKKSKSSKKNTDPTFIFKGKSYYKPQLIYSPTGKITGAKYWEDDPRFKFMDWRHPKFTVWQPINFQQWLSLHLSVYELIGAGSRGGGKTEAISIIDPLKWMYYGKLGRSFRGILFRRVIGELRDLSDRALEIYPRVIRGCTEKHYNKSLMQWRMPNGEYFKYHYYESFKDANNIKGHNYCWVGFEELTTWEDLKAYNISKATLRMPHPNAPNCIRATTNPDGIGRMVVKEYFRLPNSQGHITDLPMEEAETKPRQQACIEFRMQDNPMLPATYLASLKESAVTEAIYAAWVEGSWDNFGGNFWGQCFNSNYNIIPSIRHIPEGWDIGCGFDWGFSNPFAVGWFGISDGTPIGNTDVGLIKGDIVLFHELYGCSTKEHNKGVQLAPKEIANLMNQVESTLGIAGRVYLRIADAAIFSHIQDHNTVASLMAEEGIYWDEDASKASKTDRIRGWDNMRQLFKSAHPTRESRGLFITDNCTNAVRTVPSLPEDQKKQLDVDTNSEDHIGDMIRYFTYYEPVRFEERGF